MDAFLEVWRGIKWAFVASAAVATLPATTSFSAEPSNVVLVTLDGVRWQEVFHGIDPGQSTEPNTPVFPFLSGELSKQGPLYGDVLRGDTVTVANKAQNSLPGYQSIMAGATQPCFTNMCGRIKVETLQERLIQDLKLQPEQVATIASWEKISLAVEHVQGSHFINAGNRPLKLESNERSLEINQQQEADTPNWKDARYDKYTFAHAMNYLKSKRPRFLFISLNDSDEWGHKGKYEQYLATLRQHDAWIKELVTTLDELGDYGKQTTLIVTTDHGRGDGNDWNDHGSGYPGSKSVWIYGRSPYSKTAPKSIRAPAAKQNFSHLDIRPTIEATFGLAPKLDGTTTPPGRIIEAIVGPKASKN